MDLRSRRWVERGLCVCVCVCVCVCARARACVRVRPQSAPSVKVQPRACVITRACAPSPRGGVGGVSVGVRWLRPSAHPHLRGREGRPRTRVCVCVCVCVCARVGGCLWGSGGCAPPHTLISAGGRGGLERVCVYVCVCARAARVRQRALSHRSLTGSGERVGVLEVQPKAQEAPTTRARRRRRTQPPPLLHTCACAHTIAKQHEHSAGAECPLRRPVGPQSRTGTSNASRKGMGGANHQTHPRCWCSSLWRSVGYPNRHRPTPQAKAPTRQAQPPPTGTTPHPSSPLDWGRWQTEAWETGMKGRGSVQWCTTQAHMGLPGACTARVSMSPLRAPTQSFPAPHVPSTVRCGGGGGDPMSCTTHRAKVHFFVGSDQDELA